MAIHWRIIRIPLYASEVTELEQLYPEVEEISDATHNGDLQSGWFLLQSSERLSSA